MPSTTWNIAMLIATKLSSKAAFSKRLKISEKFGITSSI